MKRLKLRSAQRGVTLAELLVTLAVLAVVVTVAAPSVASVGNGMQLTAASNDLIAHLRFARSESIKRRGRVALCKSANGIDCITTGGWEQGWIVFDDADNDGTRNAAEAIVQRMGPLPQGWRMAGNASVARYISYDATGTTRTAGGGFQAGTVTLCHESRGPTEARQVILNIAGRPRVQKTTVAQCA